MKFKAKIEVEEKGPLHKSLNPELKDSENKRSKVDIKKTTKGVDIRVKAMDVIALKTRIYSIIKLLEVYEKAKNA